MVNSILGTAVLIGGGWSINLGVVQGDSKYDSHSVTYNNSALFQDLERFSADISPSRINYGIQQRSFTILCVGNKEVLEMLWPRIYRWMKER